MIKESITLDETIAFLNELIADDRPAIAALIATRVPCNEKMANHETVQCGAQHGGYNVGMLGILNGMFGVNDSDYRTGWGAITFVFENGSGSLLRVERSNLLPPETN